MRWMPPNPATKKTALPAVVFYGADEGTRTLDLSFTKALLYQLSYIGSNWCRGSELN